MLIRHLLSIALLPFVGVVIVPRSLLARDAVDAGVPSTLLLVGGRVAGALVFALGLALFTWCVALFARVGRGTLAPWDPTKRLVVVGPYRHVRNPMITAVCTMLAGEALFFHSYFLLLEEPGLLARFGDEYARYHAAVPRWVPRRHGWP